MLLKFPYKVHKDDDQNLTFHNDDNNENQSQLQSVMIQMLQELKDVSMIGDQSDIIYKGIIPDDHTFTLIFKRSRRCIN